MRCLNKKHIWEEPDDKVLIEMYDSSYGTNKDIARVLNVDPAVVRRRVRNLVDFKKTHYKRDGRLYKFPDLDYVKANVREGWILNPNEKVVNGILKGLRRCMGECPCVNDAEDRVCPCSNYREHDRCCCTLYVKENEAEEND